MSRLRKSLDKIDKLSSNEYLEPTEQDDLIALLTDASIVSNQYYVKVFTYLFIAITPIYVTLPFFKKNPIVGLISLIITTMSIINLHYFNYYKLLLDQKIESEFLENTDVKFKFMNRLYKLIIKENATNNVPKYYISFNLAHFLLSILLCYFYHKRFEFSLESAPLICIPVLVSSTSIIVNYWIKQLAYEITGLKKFKYFAKTV